MSGQSKPQPAHGGVRSSNGLQLIMLTSLREVKLLEDKG